MGYLSTRLSRLEQAAGVRRDEIDTVRRRAADEEFLAMMASDAEAARMARHLACRLLDFPAEPWDPPDLAALPTAELKRRLDERIALGRAAL